MKEFWNMIQLIFTAMGGWLGYFLGGCDGLLIALVLFAVVDYLTGIMTNILPVIVSASMAIVKGVLNFVIAIIVFCLYDFRPQDYFLPF